MVMLQSAVVLLAVFANVLSFAMMGIDKSRARAGQWRISEKTLFLCAGCFGALGGTLGMRLFRHKTKHWYFRYGFPVMLAAQAIILLWLLTR